MTQPRLLGGRYQLDGVVGRGGMAEVYRAHDLRLERQVAVKTLRADLAQDETFQARFRREAQSAASLNHPAVIAVYDTGEDVVVDTSVPYIVMEYVEGRTLRELLREERKLLPERVLEMTDGTLRALDYSHRNGIVHRDIKPANVMLTNNGDVKVMDFGIARAVTDASSTMTQTAQVIGTAQYLSPEQARGERVDARSDIYSTGCVVYELLTGSPPFQGDSPVAIAYQHVRENPIPPSQVDPEIPAWADAIVLSAMAKDADQRYQSAAEMRADVQRALSGLPVEAGALAMAGTTQQLSQGAGTQAIPPTSTYGEDEEHRPKRKLTWLWYTLTVLVVLGLAVLAGLWLVQGGTQGSSAKVMVPYVLSKTEAQAVNAVQNKDLKVEVRKQYYPDMGKGQVFKTDPKVGTEVEKGSTVTLFVSKGSQKVSVPNLDGKTVEEAKQRLKQAGLELGSQNKQPSSEPEGTIIGSEPPGGERVSRGTSVDVTVSGGGATVPNVLGDSVDQARSRLEGAGFVVSVQQQTTTNGTPGTVITQSPEGGSKAGPGSVVTITVAQAPTQDPSPSESVSPTESPGDGDPGDDDWPGPIGAPGSHRERGS